MSDGIESNSTNETAWISKGYEELLYDARPNTASAQNTKIAFDVIVVGSGYGGAVAAARLAGKCDKHGRPLKIAVLERGKEYLPGMFPSSFSSLPAHARLSSPLTSKVAGFRDGLFDIRADQHLNTVLANGLGGGSLINAGVMEVPTAEVFDQNWPQTLRKREVLTPYYREMKEKLGAVRNGVDNTILRHQDLQNAPPAKFSSIKKLAHNSVFRPAAISVAMEDCENSAATPLSKCQLCGDCATGCNYGAKDSLDTNLLASAFRNGVELYTGVTCHSIEKCETGGWVLNTSHTDETLAKRETASGKIFANKVILAAGAMGSTEILLKSRTAGLSVSDQLGKRFSGNGDMLTVGYDQSLPANAIANEFSDAKTRKIGPTITGVIDKRNDNSEHAVVIEEMAVPGPLQRVFQEIFATANTLHSLSETDSDKHEAGQPNDDPISINEKAFEHSSLYAIMGDDGADGELRLSSEHSNDCDGSIRVHWPQLAENKLFESQISQLQALSRQSGVDGKVLPNPIWKIFPDNLRSITGVEKGPLITVHPLGGCTMANSSDAGVVDDIGRVFRCSDQDNSVYDDLVVLDGAVIPSALGTNPALTIAAIAARATDNLIETWQLRSPESIEERPVAIRPIYRHVEPPAPPQPTTMQFVERLRGHIQLNINNQTVDCIADITLFFAEKNLSELTATFTGEDSKQRTLTVDTGISDNVARPANRVSELRIFKKADWDREENRYLSGRKLDEALDKICLAKAPLSGGLTILGREPSSRLGRSFRALWAFQYNRGWRDLWKYIFPLQHEKPDTSTAKQSTTESSLLINTITRLLNLSSRSGECRLFEYELSIDTRTSNMQFFMDTLQSPASNSIKGVKRITYNRRANPLKQLSEINLTEFPGLISDKVPPVLCLVPEFLAKKGLPLFRIINQQNTALAMLDLVSLATYFARLLLTIHPLSFRPPDLAAPITPQRLPGNIPGLPIPEIVCIPVPHTNKDTDGMAEYFRLTRYRRRHSDKPPVLMIHGYSASGTSFAHPNVNPNLASYLWHQSRDVWVLDMRSSCGMPTAKVNWTFEDMAYADIPLAVEELIQRTNKETIDVIAHCMGAAMLSMSILSAGSVDPASPYISARQKLPSRIRKLVLSQVGPVVNMAPQNIFRAYIFSYLKHLLPLENYTLSTVKEENSGTQDTNMLNNLLDWVLTALPYPDSEYNRENPRLPWKRNSYSAIRHRMDALYGRTYSVNNLSPQMLERLDDIFGPLSVDTATQVTHFAKLQTITDHGGDNPFVSRANIQHYWKFPTLSVHGEDNGLADVSTVGRMETIMNDAGVDYQSKVFPGFGHQDCLIGESAEIVFQEINQFLDKPLNSSKSIASTANDDRQITVQIPWAGPVIGAPFSPTDGINPGSGLQLPVMFGLNPALSTPLFIALITLEKHGEATAYAVKDLTLRACPKAIDGWVKMTIPVVEPVTQVLILAIYDEHPDLDNATFGKGYNYIDSVNVPSTLTLDNAVCDSDSADNLKHCSKQTKHQIETKISDYLTSGNNDLAPGLVVSHNASTANTLSFAFASCQFAAGILDQVPAYRSYNRLSQRLQQDDYTRPDFLLLVGDQVYVDSTAGLFDPSERDERFVHPYKRLYRSGAVRSVTRQLPVFTMLDDHELIDNWQPDDNGSSDVKSLEDGRASYLNFQRSLNLKPAHENKLWYSYSQNGFGFFVADSRTDRSARSIDNIEQATLFSEKQQAELEAWLLEQAAGNDSARPKFIITPAMLLPRYKRSRQNSHLASALHSDAWDGYPASLERVLRFISENGIKNVVFLSGNAHLSCFSKVQLSLNNSGHDAEDKKPLLAWSIHSSGLYAPLPFANASEADLAKDESFNIAGNAGSIRCAVNTSYLAGGDGFAVMSVYKESGIWQLRCEFDNELASETHTQTVTLSA